ncbi:hypothetical protein B0H19DRAFT_1206914 [Mycena capillaripes]|nr:hypothetical protein B0H19DRAFT_1206914 [Mycena capillaripes]
MATVTNGRILFNAIPEDWPTAACYHDVNYPVPGKTTVYDTTETIGLENVSLNGGILVEVLVMSIDPYQCGRLRSVLTSSGIGVAGSHVRGLRREYIIVPKLVMMETGLSIYIGVAGMPGETAFMGWREHSQAKKGEVAFVSGPVGSMVIQIAKQEGVKVIASASSEEKVKFMKEIGAEVAFNYKTTDVREVLAKKGPIRDMCILGQSTLDAATEFAILNSRIIECGQISGIYRIPASFLKSAWHIHGFLTPYLRPKHMAAFRAGIVPKIIRGEFGYTEDIARGLYKVRNVILAVQKGTNIGKAVVVVADE